MTEEQKLQWLQSLIEKGVNVAQINLGSGTQNFYVSKEGQVKAKQENAQVVVDECACDVDIPVGESASSAASFSKDEVLDYVGRIMPKDEDGRMKLTKFWDMLIDRSEGLKVARYNKYECCFVRGRAEDKTVDFSKKFVCSVIGYLHNMGKYDLSHIDISDKLGEGREPDNARIKDMQRCLKSYDQSVVKVVNEVIKEVFG